MLQMEKIKNGIAAMSGDVVGVIEIANDGFDASSTGGFVFIEGSVTPSQAIYT
jgi:predicted extracellular nuclease